MELLLSYNGKWRFNLLFNVAHSTWTWVRIYLAIWLENKICIWTNSTSRCLLMALWLDLLFTSARQQHTRSTICQCDDHAHSTWYFSLVHIPHNSCLCYVKSVMRGKDFSVQCHKWSLLRPISVIDFARLGKTGMHVNSLSWCCIHQLPT